MKYRILQKNGQFYPQFKKLVVWKYFHDQPSDSYFGQFVDKVSFATEDTARNYVSDYKKRQEYLSIVRVINL